MYEKDLALHNLQWLICHKTKLNQTKFWIFKTTLLTHPYKYVVYLK